MFRTPQFDKLLDKATSNLNLDPDWPTILQICDLIRQGDVQPKVALTAIKKKITNPNPHIAYYGLLVLESCVKNCGLIIHDEIGTKQYMEQLKDIVKTTTHENLKKKILELIQAWAIAFRNSPKYTAVRDTVNIMKTEGYEFPTFKESDAMFSADTAPEWADGDVCHRCRVAFGYVQRKHHCRACGQVFCAQCSSKKSMLPKFGIEKEVRVCEACFDQVNSRPSTASSKETDLPVEYLSSSLAQQQQVPTRKTAEEVQEEEELALALALSQSEAEEKEKQKKRMTNAYKANSSTISRTTYSPPSSPVPSPSKLKEQEDTVDPELARYMNRKYWEQREAAASIIDDQSSSRIDVTSPSAPNIGSPMPQRIIIGKSQNGELDNMDEFVGHLRSQVEIFVNRMKSNSSRGRSITNDSFFQNLFMSISTMHSKLLKHIREHDDTRVMYEGLQDKLAQVKDARAALDALREEHRDRLRREAEEAERLKQMQMAQKLDIMRKKKQEYLQYQRELALQKIQERERELQMRQEQQKQQYIMGSYQPIGNYMGPSSQGSPIRQLHYQQPGNFNPMSPTANQGVYAYGTGPIGNYAMQNYGMPQINSMPGHMMPGGGMVNPQEAGKLPETMGGGQQQGMQIPQMQNSQNMGQMGGRHQIGMASVSQVPAGHINTVPSSGPQQQQIPQGNIQSGPGQMGSSVSIQHPQGMPPGPPQGMPSGPPQGMPSGPPQGMPSGPPQGMPSGPPQGMPSGPPQGMPPGPQGMPPGPQGMPPGPQGMPLGPQGIPTGPQTMPPGPPMPQHINPPNNPPTIGNIGPMSMNPGHQTIGQGQIPIVPGGQQVQQTIPFQPTTTTIIESMQSPLNVKTAADDTAELISFD